MSGLVVDLLFQGEVLRTVPFDRPALRIGRMRENDIVVDSPAASRFHARLLLEAGRVFLEDGGSENGSLVNEKRVRGRHELAPGDRILIGKHELRVRSRRLDEQALVDAQTAPPEALCDDAAEAQMETPQPGDEAEPWQAESVAVDDGSDRDEFDFEPTELAGPEDEDEALAAALVDDEPAELEPEASQPPRPPEPQSSKTPAVEASAGSAVEASAGSAVEASAGSAVGPFAGLIVQRDGKIERVVPWEGDAFIVGRSNESDLVLSQDEVSRKHARFVRTGDRYEVHDLGSVNGTLVNGSRVDVHALVVGDVITIEGFELTFVLDREPIDGAMKPAPGACPQPTPPVAPADTEWDVDGLGDLDAALAIDAAVAVSEPRASAMPGGGDATIANVMLEEDSLCTPNEPAALAPLALTDAPEDSGGSAVADDLAVADGLDDLPFAATIEQRKELAAAEPRGSSRAASVQDLGAASSPARIVTLELRLRLDQLPEPLRLVLEEAGVNDLVIPADLRLRTD